MAKQASHHGACTLHRLNHCNFKNIVDSIYFFQNQMTD